MRPFSRKRLHTLPRPFGAGLAVRWLLKPSRQRRITPPSVPSGVPLARPSLGGSGSGTENGVCNANEESEPDAVDGTEGEKTRD